ncbi:MAG: hypothetical protein ACRDLF_05200, partial [Solirubrobacteraceae bacterium]
MGPSPRTTSPLGEPPLAKEPTPPAHQADPDARRDGRPPIARRLSDALLTLAAGLAASIPVIAATVRALQA